MTPPDETKPLDSPMEPPPARPLTPAMLLRRARAHWLLGTVMAVLALLVLCAMAALHRPSYRSDTTVSYRKGTKVGTGEGSDPPKNLVADLKDDLLSRANLAPIAEELGLYPGERARGGDVAAAEELKRHVQLRPQSPTSFVISFDSTSAEEAERVTARLAQSLADQVTRRRREEAGRDVAFFEGEKKTAEDQLLKAEEQLARFVVEHPEFNRETARPAVQPSAPSDPELAALERQLSRLMRDRREDTGDAVDPKLVEARTRAESALVAAQQRLSSLSMRYTAGHPDVQGALREVKAAEEQVKAVEAESAARARQGAAEIAGVRAARDAQIQQVQREITAHRRQQSAGDTRAPSSELGDRIVANEAIYTRLKRDVDEAASQRATLETHLLSAKRALSSEAGGHGAQLVIVDPAYRPVAPAAAPRIVLGLVGLALSALFGLAAALARGFFDDRIFGAAELDQQSIRVLAVVPGSPPRKSSLDG
jgi:uncharacterized protein involved in exopolysaccharide biosynthesis